MGRVLELEPLGIRGAPADSHPLGRYRRGAGPSGDLGRWRNDAPQLAIARASAEKLRRPVERALGDSSLAEGARRLSREPAGQDGAARAADELEALAADDRARG